MSGHQSRCLRWTRLFAAAAALCSGAFWAGPFANEGVDSNGPLGAESTATAARAYGSSPEVLIVSDPFRLAVAGKWLDQPLVVQVDPRAPVLFEALDSGRFENGR